MSQRLQNTSPSQPLWQNPVVQTVTVALTIGTIAIGRGRLRYADEVKRLANMMSNTDQIVPSGTEVRNTALKDLINRSIEYHGVNLNRDTRPINKKIDRTHQAIQEKLIKNPTTRLSDLEQRRYDRALLPEMKVHIANEPSSSKSIERVIVTISGYNDMNSTLTRAEVAQGKKNTPSHEFLAKVVNKNANKLGINTRNTVIVGIPNSHIRTDQLFEKFAVLTPLRGLDQTLKGKDTAAEHAAATLKAVFARYGNNVKIEDIRVDLISHSAGASSVNTLARSLREMGLSNLSITYLAPSHSFALFRQAPKDTPITSVQHTHDWFGNLFKFSFGLPKSPLQQEVMLAPSDWNHKVDKVIDAGRKAKNLEPRTSVPMTLRSVFTVLFKPNSTEKLQLNHVLSELFLPLKEGTIKGLKQGLERSIAPVTK